MDLSYTKVKQTLVAFSCATILATYTTDRKVSADVVETDVTTEQIIEIDVEKENAVKSIETSTEENQSVIADNDVDNVTVIIKPFNLGDNVLKGSGKPEFILELKDEKGLEIATTIIDELGLFELDIPSDVEYQKLSLHTFDCENNFIEHIEVNIGNLLDEVPKETVVENDEKQIVNKESEITDESVSVSVEQEVTPKIEIEPVEVPAPVARMVTFSTTVVPNGKTYYYIQRGDTLNSLAKHFGVTTSQLQSWNNINNPNNISVGQIISVDGLNVYKSIDKETRTFASSKEFVNHLTQSAMKVAKDYNLYTSVMIAQGSLETAYGKSALALQGNNLFGIKGKYQGNSIVMRTWEEVNGKVIWINDYFRLYPSYYESLIDNAEHLRNGPSWNPNYYNGTWVENTSSYKDATAWLTGRYATDSGYGTKLNNIIDYWELTQHDKHINHFDEVYSSRTTNYQAKIIQGSHTLDTVPWGTKGSKTIANSSSYLGRMFQVVGETKTRRADWVQLNINGTLLWMDKRGIQPETMSNTLNVDYQAKIIRSGDTLNTLPWGVDGYITRGNTAQHLGKTYKVSQETTTPRGKWARIYVDGQNLWVDINAIESEGMSNTKVVDYEARIVRKGDTISSLPWGVKGYSVIDLSTNHLNSTVKVIQETTTPRASWAQIEVNGKTLGWIDIRALEAIKYDTILSSTPTIYMAEVIKSGHTLDTAPWGTKGSHTIGNSASILGQTFKVEEIATTSRATWVKIYLNGQYVWIDKAGMQSETMTNTMNIKYEAKVSRTGDTISSLPWGIEGFKVNAKSDIYLNQNVTVIQEITTPRATWAQIQVNGKVLGWIDRKALDTKGYEEILSSRKTDYQAKIFKTGHTLDSSPWGTPGFITVSKSTQYLGTTVRVVEIATTVRSTWAKFYLNGQYVWMDIVGLVPETMTNTTTKNYSATITRSRDTISTLPWGIEGFKVQASSNQYLNKKVTVLKETVTPRATWVYISIDGKELGWIDKKAITQ